MKRVTRRQVFKGSLAVTGGAIVGCGDESNEGAGGAPPGVDAGTDGAVPGAPIWETIPDQQWEVGVPVSLDLADYCTDPDGDPLAYSLDQQLPAGLALNGSVISGTPTAEYPSTDFVATADDG